MAINNLIPPNPQHAVLKRIYPWDKYNINLILEWLYEQAQQTGFTVSFEEFKLHYGEYVDSLDIEKIYEIIGLYTESYHVTPTENEQVLLTKDKILNQNIIINPIPSELIPQEYSGGYLVTPLPYVDQILKTENKKMTENVVVEKIPYYETSNAANGKTIYIGN